MSRRPTGCLKRIVATTDTLSVDDPVCSNTIMPTVTCDARSGDQYRTSGETR